MGQIQTDLTGPLLPINKGNSPNEWLSVTIQADVTADAHSVFVEEPATHMGR